MKNINGKVWKFGEDIDTDLIIAARYLNTSDAKELATHIMEDTRKGFASVINAGDIIVAGKNFGCGSSREHAPIALKTAGISAVIAPTFARIFYRNSFNVGLPIFELENCEEINEGDILKIDMINAQVINRTAAKKYNFKAIPEFMQELLECGGLMNYAKKDLVSEKL